MAAGNLRSVFIAAWLYVAGTLYGGAVKCTNQCCRNDRSQYLLGCRFIRWPCSHRRQGCRPMTLPTVEGGSASLLDFAGKPTVLNLWATWCPPCQREMPVLQQAQAEHPELRPLSS